MSDFDFINRTNADYIERLHRQFQADPRSLDPQWRAFFAGFEAGSSRYSEITPAPGCPRPGTVPCPLATEISKLVHSYRELGHFIANLDPLGHRRPSHPLLELSEFGLSLDELDSHVGRADFLAETDGSLRDLIEKLRITYCNTIGVEYTHIDDKTQREWLQQRMEPRLNQPNLSPEESREILKQLVAAEGFEEFLHNRYIGQKRFSLEGGEALIPLLNALFQNGADLGMDEMVMGMAHRGRLNVLAHVLDKPYDVMLAEFSGILLPTGNGDGDVKYHLGYSQERTTPTGRKVHLALSFNPSHLELVDPVVEGIVRAKQYYLKDIERTRVVPLLMHGDAAFTGQGIVQETLGLSEMPYWRTGGTIHIIINNQIGFTTMPKQGRFTPYPTDIAKSIQAPIFHVNGDDPEAVVYAAKLAIAFRQRFHCDVMIDLWCYRRFGHNEVDEPGFTQPLMYKEITGHPTVRDIYAKKLIDAGKITAEEVEQMKTDLQQRLEVAQANIKNARPQVHMTPYAGVWKDMSQAGTDWSAKTQVPAELIRAVADGATRIPPEFTVHPKLRRLLTSRADMGRGQLPVDWGTAEMFALGTLLLQGIPVRFVGQDVQRGTFSHRHASLHDYETGAKYFPLANLSPDQAPFIIVNTMLSELAVLGFEYGFSSADPRNMVIWEAQFGDFVNDAQAVIDQFIASGESKWQKSCGLVMLLPHGYEGQGPEHSNSYIERFLALCAENNMQVCIPSLPAQYFHLLRRQMLRNFRKPLISFMPKSLLRSELSTSSLEEFTNKTFQLVIDDPSSLSRDRVRRVLFCSGKIFFTLDAARKKQGIEDIAIVRVEQLYPFPQKEIQTILARYHRAYEICWVQEEPRNRGAWTYMEDRLRPILPDPAVLTYYGRKEAASPATGSFKIHQAEEAEIVAHALELPPAKAQLVEPPTPQQAAEKATPVSD